jgi:hypothetical protein
LLGGFDMHHVIRPLACSGCLALAVVALACGAPPVESEAAETTHDSDQPFSTTPREPNHEMITAAGLPFLRAEVVASLQALNAATDVEHVLDSSYHFDDCNFTGGSNRVQENQAAAVEALSPTATPVEGDLVALRAFAKSLHTLQDFYAHSNWVESHAAGLVDTSLTAFPTLDPYETLQPSALLVVQGMPPAGLALWRRRGAAYPDNAIVYARDATGTHLGLISGTVDYEPGDFCPTQVAMTHAELNKDRSDLPGKLAQHLEAKDLATQQTTHEWCRLLTLTRAAWGDDGDRRIFLWVGDEAAASRCGDPTDLSVSITSVTPSPVSVGQTLSVAVEVRNGGAASAYGTHVVIALPAGLAPSPTSECVPISTTSLSCYVGEVASGSTASVSASALAVLPGGGSIDATVSAHVVDSDATNDTATASVVVEPALLPAQPGRSTPRTLPRLRGPFRRSLRRHHRSVRRAHAGVPRHLAREHQEVLPRFRCPHRDVGALSLERAHIHRVLEEERVLLQIGEHGPDRGFRDGERSFDLPARLQHPQREGVRDREHEQGIERRLPEHRQPRGLRQERLHRGKRAIDAPLQIAPELDGHRVTRRGVRDRTTVGVHHQLPFHVLTRPRPAHSQECVSGRSPPGDHVSRRTINEEERPSRRRPSTM